ncbi:hypothetical protein QUA70_23290 [Microcoleus sp. LAD1_D5]|uniref:hypothetical protein n=1 Tax=unclassified Microcoleus TaxID=2642155 RepID=UPI002FD450F7
MQATIAARGRSHKSAPATTKTPQIPPADGQNRFAGWRSTILFVGVARVGAGFANGRFAILDFRF